MSDTDQRTPPSEAEIAERLRALAAEAAALSASDPLRAAERHAERAHLLTVTQRLPEAAEGLAEAARLAAAAGGFVAQGQYLYGQGLLLGRLPGGAPRAHERLRQAAALFHLQGDWSWEVRALRQRAELLAAAGDPAQARALFDLMLTRVPQTEAALRVELQEQRATVLLSQGRPADALAALETARAEAERLGDRRLLLALRLASLGLSCFTLAATEPEPFAALLEEARALDEPGLRADIHLQAAAVALRGGDRELGLREAEEARLAALQTPDPLRYLVACLLLAQGREAAGDDPGVIEILLTCKVTLERYLGKEAGVGVVAILDSLEGRWGGARLRAARTAYREAAQRRLHTEGRLT